MTERPNFLLIGAGRSGTTAAAKALSQHPDVFLTTPKEVHFFAHADAPTTYRGPGDDEMINNTLISDPDSYYRLYEGSGRFAARGDGSVSTMFCAGHSVDAIRTFADADVRLVAILREPALRAYSSYLYLRGRGFESAESFSEALALERERAEQGFHHMWRYEAMSHYAKQLNPFLEAFGDRLQLHVFEEYRADPSTTLASICEFIGVDPSVEFHTGTSVNRGGEPRSRLVARAIRLARANDKVRAGIQRVTPYALRERVRSLNLSRPEPAEAVIAELRERCTDDVAAVESILGRPIPAWHQP